MPIVFAAYDYTGNPLSATHVYNGTIDSAIAIDNVDSVNMTVNAGVVQVDCNDLVDGTKCFNFSGVNDGLNTSYNYLNG